jgi:hypothetical protein
MEVIDLGKPPFGINAPVQSALELICPQPM